MLNNTKKKVRALIRSEAKQAVLEVRKSYDKKLEKAVSENVAASIQNAQLTHEENMRLIFREEAERLITGVRGGGTGLSALSSVEKQLQRAIKENDPEEAKRVLSRFAQEKKASNAKYLAASSNLRKVILQSGKKEAFKDAEKILFDMHTVDEFTHEQFADIYNFRYPVMQSASLTQQYVRRRRMKQIGQVPDRWLPHDKQAGLLFADMVNVKHARTVFDVRIEDIEPKADVVIKPMVSRGSIGAYLVKGLNEILVPRDQVILRSWEEMLAHANDLVQRGLIENSFMEQDMIYADKEKKLPAHDLKFYTFYGEVGCVNEIAREPGLAYWWYKPDGSEINLNIKNPENSKAIGFKPEHLEIAAELSKHIPAPHMRIDFLVGEDGLYFSEFCSQTGSQVETIIEVVSPGYNRSFGNMYLKAEMRIINDLLAGKKFDAINEFNRICDERYRK